MTTVDANQQDSEKQARKRPAAKRQNLWQVFRIPIALGLLSVIGLVGALVGDGVYDAVGWVGLGFPLVVCGSYFVAAAKR